MCVYNVDEEQMKAMQSGRPETINGRERGRYGKIDPLTYQMHQIRKGEIRPGVSAGPSPSPSHPAASPPITTSAFWTFLAVHHSPWRPSADEMPPCLEATRVHIRLHDMLIQPRLSRPAERLIASSISSSCPRSSCTCAPSRARHEELQQPMASPHPPHAAPCSSWAVEASGPP
ncbi:hypothetical protein CC80DRAFT_553191 [Byssothecium circinans]|uniref:Uncharacterized protein n=1 Tax=Byssothecium circinans TaxID=147558 RepID=A0A6A5TII1_9PLEO|nr:hypothetical protein CC80DRAFT_553191 [Byssothecium circinans]